MEYEKIPFVIFYVMAYIMYRILIHSYRQDIGNYYLLYRPRFLPPCLICLWYNLGLLDGIIHLIIWTFIL